MRFRETEISLERLAGIILFELYIEMKLMSTKGVDKPLTHVVGEKQNSTNWMTLVQTLFS